MARNILEATPEDPVWLYSYHASWKTLRVSPCWRYVDCGDPEFIFVEYLLYNGKRTRRNRTRVAKAEGLVLDHNQGRIVAWSSTRKDDEFLAYFMDLRLDKIDDMMATYQAKIQALRDEQYVISHRGITVTEVHR